MRRDNHGVLAMTDESRLAVTRFHRRRQPRINLSLPVEYILVKDSAPAEPAGRLSKSETIGGGGLMLEMKKGTG